MSYLDSGRYFFIVLSFQEFSKHSVIFVYVFVILYNRLLYRTVEIFFPIKKNVFGGKKLKEEFRLHPLALSLKLIS